MVLCADSLDTIPEVKIFPTFALSEVVMKKIVILILLFWCSSVRLYSQSREPEFDVLITGGTVYDGTGGAPVKADVGIKGDRIVAIGNLRRRRSHTVIDARGLAVSPGFINMLSWSVTSLIVDGRSQGEIRQGVT